MAQQAIAHSVQSDTLADVLERVLNVGVVIVGDIRINLCDVELLTIQLRLLICSVEKAQELGIPWWWQSPQQQQPLEQQQPPHCVPAQQEAAPDLPAQHPSERHERLRQRAEQVERVISGQPTKQKGL